jgi:hypothetical protein
MLKKAATVQGATEAYKIIKSQLYLYGQYFELSIACLKEIFNK